LGDGAGVDTGAVWGAEKLTLALLNQKDRRFFM
jgi:hypothetical protein